MTGLPLPTDLAARLAPDEPVLLHHRADAASLRRWERWFRLLFTGVVALIWAVQALIHGRAILSLWWAIALTFVLVLGGIRWLFGRIRAQLDRMDAVVTPGRVIWAAGPDLPLTPQVVAVASGNAVRLYHQGRKYRLYFPADGMALAGQINRLIAGMKGADHA